MLGYRGTREVIFEIGNMFLADLHHAAATPQAWPLPEATLKAVADATNSLQ